MISLEMMSHEGLQAKLSARPESLHEPCLGDQRPGLGWDQVMRLRREGQNRRKTNHHQTRRKKGLANDFWKELENDLLKDERQTISDHWKV